MERYRNSYIVLLHGVFIKITSKRFLTSDIVQLPMVIQHQADFIYDEISKRIVKSRYSFDPDLNKNILFNCINSSRHYSEFIDQYSIQSLTDLGQFLCECKYSRIINNDN